MKKHARDILTGLILAAIGAILLGYYLNWASAPPAAAPCITDPSACAPTPISKTGVAISRPTAPPTSPPTAVPVWKIYITGAVLHPGVYPVADGQRIEDAVKLAGGFLRDADPNNINLAARLRDEEAIHIPYQGETSQSSASAQASGTAYTGSAVTAPTGSGPVNINTADSATLQTLPGIGPVTAGKIIAYRTAHGLFNRSEDLQQVPGIGPSHYAQIQALITVK